MLSLLVMLGTAGNVTGPGSGLLSEWAARVSLPAPALACCPSCQVLPATQHPNGNRHTNESDYGAPSTSFHSEALNDTGSGVHSALLSRRTRQLFWRPAPAGGSHGVDSLCGEDPGEEALDELPHPRQAEREPL